MRRHLLAAAVACGLLLAVAPSSTATTGPPQQLSLAGRTAEPLWAPSPAWYTAELHQRVVAAGAAGVPIPEGVSLPASALAFTGIRPGAWMIAPSGCTMNFVFGSPGSYHIGTAGHCTQVGDTVTLIALPGVLMDIGTTVASWNNDIGEDFALVRIHPELQDLVNPSMAIVGGPTGTGDPAFGDVVTHVGHGLVVGTGGTPRVGVVGYVGPGDGGSAFGWMGAGSPGDSGSAVRDINGPAVGDFTHLVVGTEYLPAFLAGTTARYMEQLAGMSVATAPLVPDPLT